MKNVFQFSSHLAFILMIVSCTRPSSLDIEATKNSEGAASPSITPASTATSALSDHGVISINPRDLLMKIEDLPTEGRYHLETDIRRSNSDIVDFLHTQISAEVADRYLDDTGRIDGHAVMFQRGSRGVMLPETCSAGANLFLDSEGAKLSIVNYDPLLMNMLGYELIESPQLIGEITFTYKLELTKDDGRAWKLLLISFQHLNLTFSVGCTGYDDEVTLEFVESLSSLMYLRLGDLPLSEQVDFVAD